MLAAHAAGLTMDELAARPATPIYLRPPDATLPDPRKNLVFAPAKDWIGRSDEDIIDATLQELKKLFPMHFTGDNQAKLRKFKVVKTPLSVYKAVPGCQELRPSQKTPISNFKDKIPFMNVLPPHFQMLLMVKSM